jgi:Zn finger protein HypA/HybF involved in hydrogenase expression
VQEYLDDVSKGQTICIKTISPYCKCWGCQHEGEKKESENSLPVDKSQE